MQEPSIGCLATKTSCSAIAAAKRSEVTGARVVTAVADLGHTQVISCFSNNYYRTLTWNTALDVPDFLDIGTDLLNEFSGDAL